MKKQDVRVGTIYTAKVSGGIAPVQIREERWIGEQHKGWVGVNTITGRSVTIKSAQRLRRAVEGRNSGDVDPGKPATVAAAGSPVPPKAAKAGKKGAKATKPAKAPAAQAAPKPKSAKEAKPKKAGPTKLAGLDAAVQILKHSGKAMNCKELVAAAFKQNLWRSKGATPEATIYAAIIREIAAKGGDSRFVKKDRGLFAAAKGA